MKFLKINGKALMQVNSQYWLYEDIKRYFMNKKLEFYILNMEEKHYCFIKADYPRDKLELLIMGGSTNMFAYSDYIIIKLGTTKRMVEEDERLYVLQAFEDGEDFGDYEIKAFSRWYSLAEENNGMKVLDLGELQRSLRLEKNKKDEKENVKEK